jgi:long-chain fatty acid transport protein
MIQLHHPRFRSARSLARSVLIHYFEIIFLRMITFPRNFEEGMMRFRRAAWPIVLASLAIPTAAARGGSSNRSLTALFESTGNFQNPGARSLGLGGAFIALADDASAAELNPAGLTQLTRPEASFEFRQLKTVTDVRYADAFRSGPYSCFSSDAGLGPCDARFSDRKNFLSWASLILPVGTGSTLALYRHVLDREHLRAIQPVLDYDGGPFESTGDIVDLDRQIVRTGVSFAHKIAEPLSVGVSLNLNSVSQAFRLTTFSTDYLRGAPTGGDPTMINSIQDSQIHQEKLGATAGIYWRPSEALSAGVSYSTRVQFDENSTTRYCLTNPDGTTPCDFSTPYADQFYSFDSTGSFTLPSRLGVSAGWRPGSWLVVAAEADRVKYSDNSIAFPQCAVDASGNCLFDDQGNYLLDGYDKIAPKDVWEIHAGAEAVFPFSGSGLAAVRAGYWHDPDHSFQYRGCRSIPNAASQTCRFDALYTQFFPPLGSRDHYAGGVGVAWEWGQLDVGYDWVRQTHASTLSASVVIRMR